MMRWSTVAVLLWSSVHAADITVVKDSVKIRNDQYSESGDSIVLRNTSPAEVRLDSARILISELDTETPMFHIDEGEFSMYGTFFGTEINYHYYFIPVGASEYNLRVTSSIATLFVIGDSGGSMVLTDLQITGCRMCAMTILPKYIRGTLRFFFDNGQTVDIRLYSDDLRTGVKAPSQPARLVASGKTGRKNARMLLNGRQVTGKAETMNRKRIRHRLIPVFR